MSEIEIPRHIDELDRCIDNWETAIFEWQKSQTAYAEKESLLKSWESAMKAAMIGAKMSGVMAEARVKAHEDWQPRYLEVQNLGIASETKKRILRLAEAKWETERSRQVSLRNLK